MVALVVAAGCVLVLGQGLRRVIDGGFASGDATLLDAALIGLLAVIVVMAIATYTRFYFVSWIVEQRRIAAREAPVDDPAQTLTQHQHAAGGHHQCHHGDRDLPAVGSEKTEDARELADVAARRSFGNAVLESCHCGPFIRDDLNRAPL